MIDPAGSEAVNNHFVGLGQGVERGLPITTIEVQWLGEVTIHEESRTAMLAVQLLHILFEGEQRHFIAETLTEPKLVANIITSDDPAFPAMGSLITPN